jgi:hypothetical protein
MSVKTDLKPTDLKNPHNLNKEHVAAIVQYLSRLGELDADVAERVIRFVVDGEGEEVLLTLGGMKDAAVKLGLVYNSPPHTYELYQHLQRERARMNGPNYKGPPVLWIRLGQLIEAIMRAGGVRVQTPVGWPAWLIALMAEYHLGHHPSHGGAAVESPWPVEDFEAILQIAQLPSDLLAKALLNFQEAHKIGAASYGSSGPALFTNLAGYLSRHTDAVRTFLLQANADQRVYAFDSLGRIQFDFMPIMDLLVEIGTGSAKTARDAALPMLNVQRDAARPFITKMLAEGDASQRHEAAALLWRLFGTDAAEQLRQHAAGEASDRVKQTIERLLAAPTALASDDAVDLAAGLPPLKVELGDVPLSEAARAGIREAFQQAHQKAIRQYESQMEKWTAPDRPEWMAKPQEPLPVKDSDLETLFAFAERGKKVVQENFNPARGYAWQKGPWGDWCAPPDVKLIHIVRLAYDLGMVQKQAGSGGGDIGQLWWGNRQDLDAYRGRCVPPFGLRELDAVVAALPDCKPGMVAMTYLSQNNKYQTFCDWEADAIWPLFAEKLDLLREVLNPAPAAGANKYLLANQRPMAFRVLAMLPQLPPSFVPLLWELALSENKADRPLAQAAMATVPNKTLQILVALKDGKQAIRAAAAEWLGKLDDKSAIEPLKAAFRQEKQEAVKGAMMTALDALGADVNEFLNRDDLLKEAEAGLKKKRPKGMEWFALDSLPRLHWQDSGAEVDPRIAQWWVVQSVAQKSPACGPLLRRYLAMCRPHEAAGLSRFVLAAWMGLDTAMPTQEQAAEKAQKETDRLWNVYSKQQYWVDHYKNNKDNVYREQLARFSNDFLGSAIDQKGMLAVAAAAGDGDCVKLCEQYIRKWFGNRLAQCKCLVEVLAWIKHPLAIQVLLSLANRFRTKAVRKLAEEHVQALAEREGWTIDELADRTIPDAGFERATDDAGRPVGDAAALVMDYGPRQFRVTLNDELVPDITNEDGKIVKNPPAPGKNDDPEKAKAAKKAFTDAKKIVKEVVKRQAERFYEALCTQRTWRLEDWQRYLANHPIVGKLCTRLAWSAFESDGGKEKFLGCFRPLEDGSLTNEKDAAVMLSDTALVRLAHTCNTPAELAAAWQQHFVDYDVEPLFAQFGRDPYSLPDSKKKETDVKDYEGHVLTTFKLRGRATKLGYVRGEAEDAGCFYLYRKPFPSLGLQAVLEFTGSGLPEQDMPCALTNLYFTPLTSGRESGYSWGANKMELGKIPAVLLSECVNDVKQIAADGSGFDPDWQKRSYF